MITSSFVIFIELKENKVQEEIFEEIARIIEDPKEGNSTEDNLNNLYRLNSDIVGWIKIENTNINYPVMQKVDSPNYYLRKNFYKEYSYYGTPYISELCDVKTSDNIIIYSHNMRNSQMFGDLEKYKDQEFYKGNNIIEFTTIEEESQYEIIAVLKIDVNDTQGFMYYKFFKAKDEEEYKEFIDNCKELSIYKIDETSEFGDKLITLSTCEYSNKNGRLIVVAKKIND